eukprot:5893165-Pyramimonas_sp.AAC.1
MKTDRALKLVKVGRPRGCSLERAAGDRRSQVAASGSTHTRERQLERIQPNTRRIAAGSVTSSPAWRLVSRCTTPKPNRCRARAAPPSLPSTSAGQCLLLVEARLA